MELQGLIRVATERPLSEQEAEAAFTTIMGGSATAVQIAALLVAIRTRGAHADEVAGGVRALRSAMIPVQARPGPPLVDSCGTGGGSLTTFNISTAAALIAASAGARVAKHGNRSFTSRCGSADLLEGFGIPLDLTPEQEAEVLAAAGVVFMFAPVHHPAMRHVGPVRKELGITTIMNLLGPLTNPAGARRQVVGVADPAMLQLVVEALRIIGHERALVVHGEPGLDELSPIGHTRIAELKDGEIHEWRFDPRLELGWDDLSEDELVGGSPQDNCDRVERILRGDDEGAGKAAVAINAGAVLYVAGVCDSLTAGVRLSEATIESGAGWAKLELLREQSNRFASA